MRVYCLSILFHYLHIIDDYLTVQKMDNTINVFDC